MKQRACFNSTTVQLIQYPIDFPAYNPICFNSTTVQLIHALSVENKRQGKFQFHNGTINTFW